MRIVRYSVYLSPRAYGLLQQANKLTFPQIASSRMCKYPDMLIEEGLDYLVSTCFISLQWHLFFLPVIIIICRWWYNIQRLLLSSSQYRKSLNHELRSAFVKSILSKRGNVYSCKNAPNLEIEVTSKVINICNVKQSQLSKWAS